MFCCFSKSNIMNKNEEVDASLNIGSNVCTLSMLIDLCHAIVSL